MAPIYTQEDVHDFIKSKAVNVAGDLPDVPDNLDPHVDKLCVDWCPVRRVCMVRDLGF